MKKIIFALFAVFMTLIAGGSLSVKAAGHTDISSDVYLYRPETERTAKDIERITERTYAVRETQMIRTVIFRPDKDTVGSVTDSGVMGDLAAPEGSQYASPDTGDGSKTEFSIAAAALSVAIMTIIILLRKRRTDNEKCNKSKESRNSKKSRNRSRGSSDHGIIGGAVICREYIGR